MLKIFLKAGLVALAISTAPAFAADDPPANSKGVATSTASQSDKAAVIERDSRGRPLRVSVNGQEYPVCTSDASDGCINPREAGLNWGNRPLGYWPGQPASEMGQTRTMSRTAS